MSPAPPAPRNKSGAPFASSKQSLTVSGLTCTYDMERDRIGVWGSGDGQSNSKLSGLDRLKHPGLNKAMLVVGAMTAGSEKFLSGDDEQASVVWDALQHDGSRT
ncbi:jg21928 [Pararge aegeria aegeria]|uniref:Jg21928 protein n=1 Tax=Pararge aegeria aegeria TaxID=348720 RepID=A0A8S4QV80_9NEOP|nr:jg21928 [Pararge aegeria aegeria]